MKRKLMLALAAIALMCAFVGCEMAVAEKKETRPIARPYISLPPASASYYTTDTAEPLRAQVWNWDAEDGSLTYQWYKIDNMKEFIASGEGKPVDGSGGELPGGAWQNGIFIQKLEYPLANITKTDGERYYYYLEITNNDPNATDSSEATVRSEIATISFAAPGKAMFPQITRQPANVSYQFGRNIVIAELSVKAKAPDGGKLTYQWYHNTTGAVDFARAAVFAPLADLIADGTTLIEGATEAAYRPTIDLLKPGKNFFFAEITNTLDATNKRTELSVPAVIEMEPGETALEPVITSQPVDGFYFTGDSIKPLVVKNEPITDGGTVSYQWYSNTRPNATGGKAVSGETKDTFTPPAASGTNYYYAVVTNTNPSVKSSTKTARTNSKAVRIVVTSPGSPTPNVTFTVTDPKLPANRFQYIRGYGGMDVAWANFPEQTPEDMETMYNPDTGLGFNMNRIMISPANTNVNISIRDIINSHRPNFYENVRIVNKYGGFTLASPWSPPKEWKSNNSINGGGYLIYVYRQQYADYLRSFAQHMYDAGAPIYAISISNEPNYVAGYDGCEWSPEEMRDFYKLVNPQPFTTGIRGYGGGREIPRVLTVNGESANTPYINRAALRDPEALRNIDLFGRHVYGSTTERLWDDPEMVREDGTKYEVWMTEHNINSANPTAYPNDSTWNFVWRFMNDIDLVMRLNNENAFVWWASKRFYSMLGDGQFGTRDGAPLPRGYGLSHYAKYSIDTHRINVTYVAGSAALPDGGTLNHMGRNADSQINQTSFNLDNLSIRVTAYAHILQGCDNQPIPDDPTIDYISMVMWTPTRTNGSSGINMGTIEVKLPGWFTIGGVMAHKSTGATNAFAPEEVQVSADRKSAFVTLGSGQMLSVKFTNQQ
jgi:O-glycosyl hydrolase